MDRMRYQYLKYLCLQYENKKMKIEETSFYSSPTLNGVRSCATKHDSHENKIINKIVAETEIKAIDDCLLGVEKDLREKFKESITTGTAYENLNILCSRRTFFRIKRIFFRNLDKKIV